MNDITLIKNFLNPIYALNYFEKIKNEVSWTGERKTASGQTIKIKRQMAYISDSGQPYNYAGLELAGRKWSDGGNIYFLKSLVEDKVGFQLNSVLLNLYRDGKDEIRWHSDKEPQLGDNPIIPCLNLGASRNFWFMEKATGIKTPYLVENGDLLVMGPNCQEKYLHAILKEKNVVEPRISLTFRKVLC